MTMKAVLWFLILSSGIAAAATSPPAVFSRLEGEAFMIPEKTEIVWNVSTNNLPRNLWIYQVTPQVFPAAAISNLMTIGGFGWDNLVKPRDPPVRDKNLICFRDSKGPNWTRALTIAPTLGWIEFYDEMQNVKNPGEGVPTREDAEKLALDCLFELGIDRSLLCDKKSGYETIQGKMDRSGNRLTTNVVARGVSFARLTDGVDTVGICFKITFGGHARIKDFTLTWRNLQPHEAYRVATPDEIVRFIKNGQAVVPIQDYDPSVARSASKLSVVRILPHYFDKPGLEPVDFVYPYAVLEISAVTTNSSSGTFYLRCPILGDKMVPSSSAIKSASDLHNQ